MMNNRTTNLRIIFSLGIVIVLLLALLGAFAGGLVLAPHLLDSAQAAPSAPQITEKAVAPASASVAETDVIAAYEQSLIDLYRVSVPTVVNIDVTKEMNGQAFREFGFEHPPIPDEDGEDGPEGFRNRGQGSGFVWDKEGHIVTNYHVVSGATDIAVTFADGKTASAELLGQDPNADLAVIKVDLPASELQPVSLGNSDVLQVGQLTIAIGNPFGQEFTMTTGIVSAVERTIRSGNTPFSIPEVIQTDAPINPGNSGGPLLNRHGEVIGINTQIISRSGGSSGIGFAVPVNIAKRIVPTLIEGEDFEYAWLGISGRNLDSETAEFMKLSPETRGALVISVAEDGPAAEAGLKGSDETLTVDDLDYQLGGDIIIAIDGEVVAEMDDLISYLVSETRPGDKAELTVIRADGSQEDITVILGSRPASNTFSRQDEE